MREKKVGWGQHLFKQGDQCQEIYFIVNGNADVIITNQGQENIIDQIVPGSSVGGYSVINSELH